MIRQGLPWRLDRNNYIVYTSEGRQVFWVDTTLPPAKLEQAIEDALFIIACVNDSGSRELAKPLPPKAPLDTRGIPPNSSQGKISLAG